MALLVLLFRKYFFGPNYSLTLSFTLKIAKKKELKIFLHAPDNQ